jgi:hypothetical protein
MIFLSTGFSLNSNQITMKGQQAVGGPQQATGLSQHCVGTPALWSM